MEVKVERRGGPRPNSGRKRTGSVKIWISVRPEIAEAIRTYKKEHRVTMAKAVEAYKGSLC